MDQKELRELEKRCIQEEPPECTARCPIHVDVKGFTQKAAAGLWDQAFQVLAQAMPLPGIVGRICDHPCETVCIRAEAGGPIAIGALERAVAKQRKAIKRPKPLPGKTGRVAVAGTGLDSLTAAWDLALKGYKVTLFGPAEEGALPAGIGEETLPREAIQEEMAVLRGFGVELRPDAPGGDGDRIEGLLEEFDAVYLGRYGEGGRTMATSGVYGSPDPLTRTVAGPGLVSGMAEEGEGPLSPIDAVALGRKGAVSIDRFLQKVSLTAAREKEGPIRTGLVTSLEGVVSVPRVAMSEPEKGYSGEEAREEAGRCLQCECMECVKVCVYLERFKSYPKRYIRQIYNNETILIGSHGETNRLINSCSLCGLCGVVCPNDVCMAPICMEGRTGLIKRGKMPPSAHDFALGDMESSNSEKSALALPDPGKETSAYLFFPGCQLTAASPDHVVSAYGWLRSRMEGGVGLMLRCCGAPARWAARDDLFGASLTALKADWETLGKPAIIAACPTCYQVLKETLHGAEITTLWHVLASGEIPGAAAGASGTFVVHDPCTTRYEPEIHKAVRTILSRAGCGIEEPALSEETTECCGFGGLMSSANPALAREVAKRRASREEGDYLTYCAMCRMALAGSGKKVIHLLDILFGAPADNRVPGLSERRENRHRLKERLVKELWGKGDGKMEDYEAIVLRISPEVLQVMEGRNILKEDVQKVIDHGEKAGTRLVNPDTGHWLSFARPGHVTYWVEYGPEGDGFRVYNAYCHRMEVMGGISS